MYLDYQWYAAIFKPISNCECKGVCKFVLLLNTRNIDVAEQTVLPLVYEPVLSEYLEV